MAERGAVQGQRIKVARRPKSSAPVVADDREGGRDIRHALDRETIEARPATTWTKVVRWIGYSWSGSWQALYRVGKPCKLFRLGRPWQDRE